MFRTSRLIAFLANACGIVLASAPMAFSFEDPVPTGNTECGTTLPPMEADGDLPISGGSKQGYAEALNNALANLAGVICMACPDDDQCNRLETLTSGGYTDIERSIIDVDGEQVYLVTATLIDGSTFTIECEAC